MSFSNDGFVVTRKELHEWLWQLSDKELTAEQIWNVYSSFWPLTTGSKVLAYSDLTDSMKRSFADAVEQVVSARIDSFVKHVCVNPIAASAEVVDEFANEPTQPGAQNRLVSFEFNSRSKACYVCDEDTTFVSAIDNRVPLCARCVIEKE